MTLSVVQGKSVEFEGIMFKPEYGFGKEASGIYLEGECVGFVVDDKATITAMLTTPRFRRILGAIDEFIGAGSGD